MGRAKIEIFAIISETPHVVLKRFWGRTNISLMFLFAWLDWGIDISDFEKIDFFGSWGDFRVFPAPGQADFEHQWHLRWWAENFQKVWYEIFFLIFRKTSK